MWSVSDDGDAYDDDGNALLRHHRVLFVRLAEYTTTKSISGIWVLLDVVRIPVLFKWWNKEERFYIGFYLRELCCSVLPVTAENFRVDFGITELVFVVDETIYIYNNEYINLLKQSIICKIIWAYVCAPWCIGFNLSPTDEPLIVKLDDALEMDETWKTTEYKQT